jgi:hypothetical protein
LWASETQSFTLREKLRLNVFNNRMLSGIYEIEREDKAEGWGKFNREFHKLYCSSDIKMVK